jgi:hypothetical protein
MNPGWKRCLLLASHAVAIAAGAVAWKTFRDPGWLAGRDQTSVAQAPRAMHASCLPNGYGKG